MFGGRLEGSIESLKVAEGQEWELLIHSCELVSRTKPALVVLNKHQIVCFGGRCANDGFIVDFKDHELK